MEEFKKENALVDSEESSIGSGCGVDDEEERKLNPLELGIGATEVGVGSKGVP